MELCHLNAQCNLFNHTKLNRWLKEENLTFKHGAKNMNLVTPEYIIVHCANIELQV